jgi:hypothetical protein
MRERELPTLPAWTAPLLMVGIVIGAVLLVGGRGAAGTAGDVATEAARVTTTDDGAFRLTLQAEHGSYREGERIAPGASLVYLGPKPSITLMGPPGAVLFTVEEVGGTRRIEATPAASCVPAPFERGVTVYQPWVVTGETDPRQAADGWVRVYLGTDGTGGADAADDAGTGFVLPEGDWRLTATASLAEGPDCETGPFHALEASIVVTVRGDADPTLTP